MKKLITCLCMAVALSFFFAQIVHAANETDALLKLLVKKGVITQGEAEALKAEVLKGPAVVTSSKPIKGIELGGKLEIMYEDSEGEEGTFKMTNFEPNVVVNVDDRFSIKGQLECTTDTTIVNEAYAKYKGLPIINGELMAGKFRRKSFGLPQGGSERVSVDYALLGRAFTGERQVGAEYTTNFSGLNLPVPVNLGVGIFNGGAIGTREAGDNGTTQVLFIADRAGDVDIKQNKEFSARLTVSPVENLTLGGSVLCGKLHGTDIASVNSYLGTSYTDDKKQRYGCDVTLKFPFGTDVDTELRGEYMRGETSELDVDAWYTMGILKVLNKKLDLYGRYGELNPDIPATTRSKTWDLDQMTFGGIWHFNKVTQLQVEYEFNEQGDLPAGTSQVDNDMLRVKWQTDF